MEPMVQLCTPFSTAVSIQPTEHLVLRLSLLRELRIEGVSICVHFLFEHKWKNDISQLPYYQAANGFDIFNLGVELSGYEWVLIGLQ